MLIVARTNELIAPERIGFFTLQESTQRLAPVAHEHFDMLEHRGVPFEVMKLRTHLRQPVALDDCIEAENAYEPADDGTFRRWGIAIAFPMLSEKLEILGFLVLGPKKSGEKFTIEDVSLLKVITTQAGLALERIALQRKIFIEQEASRHLAELNQMKSFFVSSVSHDLKTPLSAIHLQAELLHAHRRMSEKSKRESLEIIEGESERLAHLIDNVLDAARMDAGARHYDFADIELNAVVRRVLQLMRYEMKMRSFTVKSQLARARLPISGDESAIERAIINLIGNAMKYASDKKSITIATRMAETGAALSVADRGVGIAPDDLQRIFSRYYRSGDATTRLQPGVGLGLSIVQHVMEAHGGRVEVASEHGKGSTFTLIFPRRTTP
jgi:two-component system phosphate regulon sensor histidine kinase PhoR